MRMPGLETMLYKVTENCRIHTYEKYFLGFKYFKGCEFEKLLVFTEISFLCMLSIIENLRKDKHIFSKLEHTCKIRCKHINEY